MGKITLNQLERQNLINQYKSDLRRLYFQIDRLRSTIEELEGGISDEGLPDLGIEKIDLSQTEESGSTAGTSTKKRGPGRPPKKKGPGRPPKKKGPGRPPKAKSKRGPGRPPKKKGPGRPPKKRGPGRPPKKKGPGRPPKSGSNRGPGRPPKSEYTFTYTDKSGEKHLLSEWDEVLIKAISESGKPLIKSEVIKKIKDYPLGKKSAEGEIRMMATRSIQKLANKLEILKKTAYEGRGYAYATEEMVDNDGQLKKYYQRS